MNRPIIKLLNRAQREGWAVVIIGFFGFFIWSATYPMEQGVPGSGFVISQNEKITIVSPVTGLVINVAKKLGDSVVPGDVLIEFDSKPLESSERSAEESIRGIEISGHVVESGANNQVFLRLWMRNYLLFRDL